VANTAECNNLRYECERYGGTIVSCIDHGDVIVWDCTVDIPEGAEEPRYPPVEEAAKAGRGSVGVAVAATGALVGLGYLLYRAWR
jgi:hypothetical protein